MEGQFTQFLKYDPTAKTKLLFAAYFIITLIYFINQKWSNDLLQFEFNKLQSETKNHLTPPFSYMKNYKNYSSGVSKELTQDDIKLSIFNGGIHIPVLPLDENNKIRFPSEVKRVWIDVGAHREAMYTYPSLMAQPDLAVIAIEPMYDMWGRLLMEKHHPRMYMIPAAVSTEDGHTVFRRAATDMCSSLKGVDPNASLYKWPGGCDGTKFHIAVPTVRLESIINMIPFDTVEFVKVDAQGADFEVMQSAGINLYKIQSFVVEVQTDPLYKGAKNQNDFLEYFNKKGFEMVFSKFQNKHELNMLFRNLKFPLSDKVPKAEFLEDDKKPGHKNLRSGNMKTQ